jgi:hypothetical protein
MSVEALARRPLRRRYNLGALAKLIEVLAPPLSHLDTFFPMRASVIGSTHAVFIAMGKRPLDRIGVPLAGLVQQRRCHGPEAVCRHLIAAKAQAPQPGIDGVLAHWSRARSDGGEDITEARESVTSGQVQSRVGRTPEERSRK